MLSVNGGISNPEGTLSSLTTTSDEKRGNHSYRHGGPKGEKTDEDGTEKKKRKGLYFRTESKKDI